MNKFAKNFTMPDQRASKKRGKQDVKVIYEHSNFDERLKQHYIGKKYFIRTYGCQMNEHDTEIMRGLLESIGMQSTDIVEEAEIVIFNTCAIRENAENKVFGEIGRLKHLKVENPDKIFAICGCMSQEEDVVNRLLKTYTWVDMVFGTHNIHRLVELLGNAVFDKQKVVEVWSTEGDIIENLPKTRASNISAWVNIIYGCDKFCTYCIVPYTRGKERSRLQSDILEEVNELVTKGYKEITLLGQNVNAYGKDLNDGSSMANLLKNVSETGIERIRFSTSHPWDFDDELVEQIKLLPNVMPHVHLPVQSGNSDILKIMGRSYTREKYLELFDKLRAIDENITITTDIIVGFPNETDEQFQQTLDLYNYCKFDHAFTFIYSPRKGTPAENMEDNISMEVKKKRLYELNDLVNKYAKESNARLLNSKQKVLISGPSNKNPQILAGYSETNKLVLVEADKKYIGEIIEVKIIETNDFNLIGEMI